MKVFILITNHTVVGVYSDFDKMVSEFSTTYSDTKVDEVEV